VIVAIAAWLYIIQALLGLASLFSGPFGMGGGSGTFATLLVSGVFGAMGYGLLKREAWGRWLALGVSLLNWVFGSILLITLLGALLVSGKSGAVIGMLFSGAMAIVGVLLLIGLLIMVASIIISFKLFFYLCSEDGCEEFGVPHGSAGTVVASVGAWIAIMIGQVVLSGAGSGGGMVALLAQQAISRDRRDSERESEMRLAAERREYQRQEEERQRHAEQEARLRAIRDAENQQALDSASSSSEPPMVDSGSQMVDEARVPVMNQPEEEEKTTGSQILKCRDASGSVTFTQGYCPPGTKRVDMPRSE